MSPFQYLTRLTPARVPDLVPDAYIGVDGRAMSAIMDGPVTPVTLRDRPLRPVPELVPVDRLRLLDEHLHHPAFTDLLLKLLLEGRSRCIH